MAQRETDNTDRQTHLPDNPANDLVHIVLVETLDSLNIGSVARAMMNLGFSHLHLVTPREFDIEKASRTACWAVDIVKNALVHPSLEAALCEMQEVVGFSAKEEALRPGKLLLHEWVDKYSARTPVRTALLFGPEDSGLSSAHVEQCHWLVRIPSMATCPSFNLAQSVLLALFELRRLDWTKLSASAEARQMPEWNKYIQLDRIVEETLTECGFYRPGSPAPIPSLIKNLFRRMDMDDREMNVMLALFNRIHTYFGVLERRAGEKP